MITVALSDSDEFTTIAVEEHDGRTELLACGPLPDVFTELRLTPGERRKLAEALLQPDERIVVRTRRKAA